jgi:hypothetical protein
MRLFERTLFFGTMEGNRSCGAAFLNVKACLRPRKH